MTAKFQSIRSWKILLQTSFYLRPSPCCNYKIRDCGEVAKSRSYPDTKKRDVHSAPNDCHDGFDKWTGRRCNVRLFVCICRVAKRGRNRSGTKAKRLSRMVRILHGGRVPVGPAKQRPQFASGRVHRKRRKENRRNRLQRNAKRMQRRRIAVGAAGRHPARNKISIRSIFYN